MPRVRTPRFVFALAVLLVALQFFGLLVPGTSGAAPATQEWSTAAVVTDRADEYATCGDAEQIVAPPSRPVGRDRHRSAAQPDTKPSVGSVPRDRIIAPPPGGGTGPHLASGSSTSPSLTSLQTFRC